MKRFFTRFTLSSFSLVAALMLLLGQQSFGQVAKFTNSTTASTVATNSTVSTLTNSRSISFTFAKTCTPTNPITVTNLSNSTTSATNYLTFTSKPSSGYQINGTSITIDARRTGAGPTNGRIDYSTDGGVNFTSSSDFTSISSNSCSFTTLTFTSSFVASSATNGVIVRLYFWGSTTGDLDFLNVTLNGTVASSSCTVPNEVTNLSASNGYSQSALTWTNGSCFDEILVIAKQGSSISFTPTGNGSSYSPNSSFGLGTDVGSSQYVVFKGSANTQTVLQLTNDLVYYFKVFTRKGTTWTSGVETNATPSVPIYTWTGGTNSTWLTTSNWDLGNYPRSSTDLVYFNNTTQLTTGINMNTLSGALALGAIDFGTSATSARTINNSSGTVSGILTISGLTLSSVNNIIIRNQSSANHTIADGVSTMGLALDNSTENIIRIEGTGGITISSIISGSSKNLTKGGSGAGFLTLTGANTYTGLTTVSAGTLKLNRTGGTTIPVTNNMTISGGTLQVSSNQTIANLTMTSGTLTVDAGVTLTITGTYSLSGGTINNLGTIKLNGSAVSFPGTGVTVNNGTVNNTMTNLEIATSGDVTLTGNVIVSGSLTLTTGKITLGTNNLTTAFISGGSSSSYVVTNSTGALTINAVTTATFPVGPTSSAYNPVTITNGDTKNYAVTVSATAPTGGGITQPTKVINRTWDITPNTTPTKNVGLAFTYNDGEGASAFNNTVAMDGLHFLSGSWQNIGTAMPTVSAPYVVSFTNLSTSWSPFSFGNAGVLAAEITKLSAKAQNTQNLITWQTATEKNTHYFDVERSANGLSNWQTMGTVKAAGQSQTVKDYQFADDAPLSISYYRLRSVDMDGSETKSNVVSVSQGKNTKLTVYPSTVTDKLMVSTDNDDVQTYIITDLLGRHVQTGQFRTQIELNVGTLAAGIYMVKVGTEIRKFVVR